MKKKREAIQWVGFAEKGRFKPGMKERGSDGILRILSIGLNVSSITIKYHVSYWHAAGHYRYM